MTEVDEEYIKKYISKSTLYCSNGMYNEALEVIEQIKKYSEAGNIIKLMQSRIYNSMGDIYRAKYKMIDILDTYTPYCETAIINDFFCYEWNLDDIKYLSQKNINNEIAKYLSKVIYCKVRNDLKVLVEEVNNVCLYLMKNSNFDTAIDILVKIFVDYCYEGSEIYLRNSKQLMKKIILMGMNNGVLLKSGEEINQLKAFCKNIFVESEQSLQTIICYYDNSKINLYNEDYNEIAKIKFVKKSNENIKKDKLINVLNYNVKDNHILYCSYIIMKLFGVLRSGKSTSREILKSFLEVNENVNKLNNRYINTENAIEIMLYYISACEIYIINSKKDKALSVINECREKLKRSFGLYIHEILFYGRDIMDFYEGWIVNSYDKLENVIKKIPDNNLLWIHRLYDDIRKNNILNDSEYKIENTKQAFKLLNILFMNFEEILDEKLVDSVSKELMRKNIDLIREKLGETELKICIVGETGNGKTTFLNTMFNTNLFFTTQEEATGVPTEIRKGNKIEIEVYDKNGNIRSRYDGQDEACFNGSIEKTNIKPEEFILKHTKVNEEALEWVEKVKVRLPIEEMPDELVIIDTPGFNAHEKRTLIAQKAMEEAHVCIFIIDARNALKSKEMDVLNIARNEAGKTFFVLNKMDLIEDDDELDCEDEGSINDLLDRAELNIKEYFKLDKVMIYPVSSVKTNNKEKQIFVDNINILKNTVFNEAAAQKLDLIIDMTAKEMIKLSNQINLLSEELIKISKNKGLKLKDNLPNDFQLFKNQIVNRILDKYRSLKHNYIESFDSYIKEQMNIANDGFYQWINSISSKIELKNNCQKVADRSLNCAMNNIQQERIKELESLSNIIVSDISNIFKELYKNISFSNEYNANQMLRHLADIKFNLSGSMRMNINNIEENLQSQGGAGIIGAGIGLLLGPLGAIAGGVIGAALFDSSIDNMKREVANVFDKVWDESYSQILEICNVDLNENDDNSFFYHLLHTIDIEFTNYENSIKEEKYIVENEIRSIKKKTIFINDKKMQIEKNIKILEEWRNYRKNRG